MGSQPGDCRQPLYSSISNMFIIVTMPFVHTTKSYKRRDDVVNLEKVTMMLKFVTH